MALSALEALAAHSHQQAERAVAEASAKLTEPLDQKTRALADFRGQVKTQTKSLRQLITSCETRAAALEKHAASASHAARATRAQAEIELLNQHIRVVERARELRDEHAAK